MEINDIYFLNGISEISIEDDGDNNFENIKEYMKIDGLSEAEINIMRMM